MGLQARAIADMNGMKDPRNDRTLKVSWGRWACGPQNRLRFPGQKSPLLPGLPRHMGMSPYHPMGGYGLGYPSFMPDLHMCYPAYSQYSPMSDYGNMLPPSSMPGLPSLPAGPTGLPRTGYSCRAEYHRTAGPSGKKE